MQQPRLEVAEVLRSYGDEYLSTHPVSGQQRRATSDLIACRTATLGGHRRRCTSCGNEEIAYNSCRNRHCPKCQGKKQALWLQARSADLLEIPYFHIVFTLPEALGPLVLQNQRVLYGLLFRATAETLLTIARDEKHLGAKIGFTAILHTWGQTLLYHPHVHCVVPAGGLSPDARQWIAAREGFFLPVRVLSRLFREKYLAYLREAYQSGDLVLAGRLENLREERAWRTYLAPIAKQDWVVYAKPPFGSPAQVLKYLARYTHRVAISNRRLIALEDGMVAFSYKDYKRGHRRRVTRLSAIEFMRRFLLHVLPRSFMRIRHYGLLANRMRRENLRLCRRLLNSPIAFEADAEETPEAPSTNWLCPVCEQRTLLIVSTVAPSFGSPEPRMNSPNDA